MTKQELKQIILQEVALYNKKQQRRSRLYEDAASNSAANIMKVIRKISHPGLRSALTQVLVKGKDASRLDDLTQNKSQNIDIITSLIKLFGISPAELKQVLPQITKRITADSDDAR